MQSKFDAELDEFAGIYRGALEAFEGLARVRAEAQGSGFAAEAAALLSAPHILDRSLLERLETEIGRRRAATQPKPAPAPRAQAKPAPKAVAAPVPAPKPALKAAAPIAPPTAPAPFKPIANSEGKVRVVFLKSGYHLPDGTRPKVSDAVDLSADVADNVVRATVAEFAQCMEAAR